MLNNIFYMFFSPFEESRLYWLFSYLYYVDLLIGNSFSDDLFLSSNDFLIFFSSIFRC